MLYNAASIPPPPLDPVPMQFGKDGHRLYYEYWYAPGSGVVVEILANKPRGSRRFQVIIIKDHRVVLHERFQTLKEAIMELRKLGYRLELPAP